MDQYLPVFAMFVLAVLFAGISFFASRLLSPRRETSAKTTPYESGIVPHHEPAQRFPVRFFLVAMIFIIFDIEIIFLFPWAVIFGELGLFGLAEMGVFALAVFVSFLWLVSRGGLDWGPAHVARPALERTMRSSENTVVRFSASQAERARRAILSSGRPAEPASLRADSAERQQEGPPTAAAAAVAEEE